MTIIRYRQLTEKTQTYTSTHKYQNAHGPHRSQDKIFNATLNVLVVSNEGFCPRFEQT